MSRRLILFLTVTISAGAQPAVLTVTLVEGEGAVYPTGSRATRGVTVKVTDESGRPVEGATVTFSLPTDGPGGVFASGGRTEVRTRRWSPTVILTSTLLRPVSSPAGLL